MLWKKTRANTNEYMNLSGIYNYVTQMSRALSAIIRQTVMEDVDVKDSKTTLKWRAVPVYGYFDPIFTPFLTSNDLNLM